MKITDHFQVITGEMTLEEAAMDVAKSFGWDCFKENADA